MPATSVVGGFTNLDNMKLVLADVPEFTGATEVEACVNAVAWLLEKGYCSKEK